MDIGTFMNQLQNAPMTPELMQQLGPMAAQLMQSSSAVDNTPLNAAQYAQYMQDWGKKAPLDEQDYDLRGAWLGGFKPNTGHGTDQFKKPNHPTFSQESQYSTPLQPGGTWTDNTYVPSPAMYADQARMAKLIQYLKGPAEHGKIFMVPPTIAAPQGNY